MGFFSAKIVDIHWTRIYLKAVVDVEGNSPLDEIHFYLLNKSYYIETEFVIESRKNNRFLLSINVTNNGTNRCIANGDYSLFVYGSDTSFCEAGYIGTEEKLAAWGRSFRYNGTSGIYSITVTLDENAEIPRVIFQIYNASRGNINHIVPRFSTGKKEPPFCIVKRKIKKKIRKMAGKLFSQKKRHKIRYRVYQIAYKLSEKMREKRILFLSEQDDTLALNMQALYDRLIERGLDKEYKIYISLRKATTQKCSIRSTIRLTLLTAMCGTILIDDHVPFLNWLKLYPGNRVIQIWHAGAGFKGVGYSRWGHSGCPGPYSCHRQYTYSISGSSSISEFFSEQFGILYEQVIPTGLPRMDSYIDPENRKRVQAALYQAYPQISGKRVVLFAPTYRGRDRKHAYYPYDLLDFDELYSYCTENDTVVLFKMHPWVNDAVPIRKEHADRFFDFNGYRNINELFYITDLLITDYSSSMYEFILMDKPVLLFAFDKISFSVSRGFHRDYDSNIPGKLCETFEELMSAMHNKDYEFYKVKEFKSTYFEFIDCGSTDRVIDWLICGTLPEEYQIKLKKKQDEIRALRQMNFKQLIQSKSHTLQVIDTPLN